MKQDSAEHHDMMFLFDTMSRLANMEAYCHAETILTSNDKINDKKQKMKEVSK